MPRWFGRAPAALLTGHVVDVGDIRLPVAGPGARPRWDLNDLLAALDGHAASAGSHGLHAPISLAAGRTV
ncbi:MAG: hypothetical protein WBV06_02725 [Acidimicrobiia bacterium]